MTPEEAVAAARFAVKYRLLLPAEAVGVLLAELDARGVAIARVRELVDRELMAECCSACYSLGVQFKQLLDGAR